MTELRSVQLFKNYTSIFNRDFADAAENPKKTSFYRRIMKKDGTFVLGFNIGDKTFSQFPKILAQLVGRSDFKAHTSHARRREGKS